MELPEDVLTLIRAFSKPVCRVDWCHGSYIRRNYLTLHHDLFIQSYRWKERNLLLHDYIRYVLDICDDFTI